MNGFVLVEWGGGSGFHLYTPPGRSPAPPPFVAATEKMIVFPVGQPKEPLGDPVRYPVWTLLATDVEGYGDHWCFTVQGQGGAFGRSGTCQFLFAPAQHHPAQVWRHAVTLVNSDGRLGTVPVRPSPLGTPEPDELMAPLIALHRGQRLIAVDGEPLAVAGKIAALVAVLPIEEVRTRVWSTFVLNEPVLDQRPVLSGHWPSSLAVGSTAATKVRRWLGELPPVLGQLDRREEQVLGRLAEWGCANEALAPKYRSVPDMRTLVAALARDVLEILPDDVPELIHRDIDQLRTERGRRALRTWARTGPGTAVVFLSENQIPADLVDTVFDGLFAAHEAGGNPMSFPPSDTHTAPSWQNQLAEAVRSRFPTRRARMEFAEKSLFAPGRPMADPAARHAALPWLESIGIAADDLPASVELIAETLRDGLPVTERQAAFLRDTADPVGTLRSLVKQLGMVGPGMAAKVMGVVDDDIARRDFVKFATWRRHELGDRDVARWVNEFLELCPTDQLAIVEGAFAPLREAGQLTDAMLALALSEYADRRPPNTTSRELLLEAAERLAPPAPSAEQTGLSTESWPAPGTSADEISWSMSVPPDGGLANSRYPDAARAYDPAGRLASPAPGEPTPIAGEPRHLATPSGVGFGPENELAPGLRLLIIIATVVVVLFAVHELFIDRL